MYEVEIKIEISERQKDTLVSTFQNREYVSKGNTLQNDYYIEANVSPYGGWDLKRYRNEAGTFIYTEKVWELIEGKQFRKETEKNVSKEEFDKALIDFPNAVKIIKDRAWYDAGRISLTIDSVKFDHSASVRYFIEAEIGVTDKAELTKTKDEIKYFLQEILNTTELVESPGMFTMAFEAK